MTAHATNLQRKMAALNIHDLLRYLSPMRLFKTNQLAIPLPWAISTISTPQPPSTPTIWGFLPVYPTFLEKHLPKTLENIGFLWKTVRKNLRIQWPLTHPICLQLYPRFKRFSTRCRVAASVKSCKGSGRKSVAMTQPSKANTAREARPQPHPATGEGDR